MKKILICMVTLLLILGITINVYANEEIVQDTTDKQNIANTEIVNIEVKAKVLEAGETKQVQTGSITDTVQEIKIKILEGSHKGEEYNTSYVLSYDIEGKILAYELEKDDVVWVHLTENSDGTVGVTVENLVRQNYILLMVLVFFRKYCYNWRKKRYSSNNRSYCNNTCSIFYISKINICW